MRAFDATVGTSPMAHLRQMRAERMARLLASTDLSVAEAARPVGWTNQFHASHIFHDAYGVSPTADSSLTVVPILHHRQSRTNAHDWPVESPYVERAFGSLVGGGVRTWRA